MAARKAPARKGKGGRKPGEIKADGTVAVGSGRPAWEPTAQQRAQVKDLAAKGVPEHTIAALMGLGSKLTLRAHCQEELDSGRAIGIGIMMGALYKQGVAGSYKHAAFWLANVAGMGTNKNVHHTGTVNIADRLARARARLNGRVVRDEE